MNVELERLGAFVGEWATTGEIGGRPFTASDTYEWLAGEHFLVHRFDAFDSTGKAATMVGRSEEGVWTFTGERLRFTGEFRGGGGVFGGVWEQRLEDALWVPLMTVLLKKIS